MTQKEEIVSTLYKLAKGISDGEIKFLGYIKEEMPKYKPIRESNITTVTFQYEKL